MKEPDDDSSKIAEGAPANYLQGAFHRELNYKLWSTKGARFVAARRLKLKASASLCAISMMSFYLIIFSLIPAYTDPSHLPTSEANLALINVSLGVFVLMLSQILNRSDFQRRSDRYHECALAIAKLYNRLRTKKTMEESSLTPEFVREINEEYDEVLDRYENHEQIDFDLFRAKRPKYKDHDIKWFKIPWYYTKYYFGTLFGYHCLIVIPLVGLICLLIATISSEQNGARSASSSHPVEPSTSYNE
jgi:hypothetical protein